MFVWARSGVPVSLLAIVSQPLDQEVLEGDTVTFSVVASGSGALTYQWTCNGANISGATDGSYTISSVQDSDAAGYAVAISNGVTSISSRTAQLTVDAGTGDPLFMILHGPRQDYSFKDGVTYYLNCPVELYGTTTLRGGSVIKPDWYYTNSSLVVKGSLVCNSQPYYPCVLTSVDDDSVGEPLGFSYFDGPPQPYAGTAPYLNLDGATSATLGNARFCYANMGVTTPVLPGKLDVWDCQFFECDYAIANLVPTFGAVDFLHNVLFARCGAAVAASTNSIEIEAEHVTADVRDFWMAGATPFKIGLTNSIIKGSFDNAAITMNQNSAINPTGRVFQKAEQGDYYLAANSSLHGFGTTNVNIALLAEFGQKTTSRPFSFPALLQISGDMVLFPQVPRYTNGPPDIGYWYDALDYTIANVTLMGGTVTVEPGTAIAVRNEYLPAYGVFTVAGFVATQGASVISHGTPNKPNIFTAVKQVQERPETDFSEYEIDSGWWFGTVAFLPDFVPGDPSAPTLDFRFCRFYLPPNDYHLWCGLQEWPAFEFIDAEASLDSAVYLTMQDCRVHGGRITFGNPDYYYYPWDYVYAPGAVTFANNLFDQTSIYLDPTYYEYGVDDNGLNVDLAFQAYNNLFRGGLWFELGPVPASAGNWTFNDNLFDKVDFIQNTALPLDFAYNAYWPKQSSELFWPGLEAAQLQPTTTGDGFTDSTNEPVFTAAPPYQCGPFGDYYMPTNSILYQAGSRTADAEGFCQYTTQTNQTKEAIGQTVDIGLHYIAATVGPNGCVPMDTDGDGIPDYVEDANGNGIWDQGIETDWQNPTTYTDTNGNPQPDKYSFIYADIDLSGNGLVGRIKAALGMDPFDTSNPLVLTQIITGQEPDIATFEIPISYALVTNIGSVNLQMNGIAVKLDKSEAATNGNCMVVWNTTYDPPYQHYLQAQLKIYGSGSDMSIFTGVGPIYPFYSRNVLQFFESGSMYDDNGAYLDAQLPCLQANYTIDIYDPSVTPPVLVKTITNSTSNGMIQEDWDLTYQDGVTLFSGDTADAVFHVTLLDPASGMDTKHLVRVTNGMTEAGPNFDFTYFYTLTNSSMTAPFAQNGDVWCGMLNAVDVLTMPDNGYDVYQSYFNHYYCFDDCIFLPDPGYLTSMSVITNSLFPDMANGLTKQFYCSGHGTHGSMASDFYYDAHFLSEDIDNLLHNNFDPPTVISTPNPYRFVFLDGCATAADEKWSHTFGIYPFSQTSLASRNKVGPQAFVGWWRAHEGWITTPNVDIAVAYTQTLSDFYYDWMNGATVAECIAGGSVNLWVRTVCRYRLRIRKWHRTNRPGRIQLYFQP